jgi:hypothetical protein
MSREAVAVHEPIPGSAAVEVLLSDDGRRSAGNERDGSVSPVLG